MDRWVEIQSLHNQGLSNRAIANKLNISRNTVRKALGEKSPSLPRVSFHKIVPYQDTITQMLNQRLIGTRILHTLKHQGYQGGTSAFYEFLNHLKESMAKVNQKATVRYETLPGVQAQFDWSIYHIPFGGNLTRVVVYNLLLSYSRRKFYWPALKENQDVVFEAIEQGFARFGGGVKEILVDNARVFVEDSRRSHFKWNTRFFSFCRHYRIIPKACAVRRPQTKGKVERPFYYLEQHFIKGNPFFSFDDFSKRLLLFNDELDLRVHHTLGMSPLERFEEEKKALSPLPVEGFLGKFTMFRKVSQDCLISYDGSRYSAPWVYAGKEVGLRVSQGVTLEIFSTRGELLTTHRLTSRKGSVVVEHEHYAGLRKQTFRPLVHSKERFLEEFPDQALFLEKLCAQYKWNAHLHLRGVLDLLRFYSKAEMKKAFQIGLEYNTFSLHVIRGILEKYSPLKIEEPSVSTLVEVPKLVFKRDLSQYHFDFKEKGDEQDES